MQHSPTYEIKDQTSFRTWIRKESYIRCVSLHPSFQPPNNHQNSNPSSNARPRLRHLQQRTTTLPMGRDRSRFPQRRRILPNLKLRHHGRPGRRALTADEDERRIRHPILHRRTGGKSQGAWRWQPNRARHANANPLFVPPPLPCPSLFRSTSTHTHQSSTPTSTPPSSSIPSPRSPAPTSPCSPPPSKPRSPTGGSCGTRSSP